MFERRLKSMGIVLAVMSIILLGRLVQVQVLARSYYTELAQKAMTQQRSIPTTRGPILDVRGRVLAADEACIDAAVDFRAVTRDTSQKAVKAWIAKLAIQRLRTRGDPAYLSADAPGKRKFRDTEEVAVTADITAMWTALAEAGGVTVDEIQDTRTNVEVEVRKKKKWIVQSRFRAALDEAGSREKPAWYARWLAGGVEDTPTEDEFDNELIYEQQSAHVIVRALTPAAQNELGRNLDKYPGLMLQPSKHRAYPYGNQAAHVIGYLTRVQRKPMAIDPDANNDRRAYLPNDLAGRDGIEALAERQLRGSRGAESQLSGDWASAARVDPSPGQPVTTTIDIELQAQIREMFTRVRIPSPALGDGEYEVSPMHGSAVVIDLASGEVRAMVSYPDYNLNTFSEQYSQLREDEGNIPLFHRALMSQYEPGSTIKPVVGLSAMTAGVATINECIECNGYLVIRNKKQDRGRCWTLSIDSFPHTHRDVPSSAPHPTGLLNFHDAIERSCNVYFENMADRLGTEGLSAWMERFGLGRNTGIGLAEKPGRLPRQYRGAAGVFATWTAGIGQVSVLATPLQVANATATVARRGIWMRPKLVRDGSNLTPWQPSGNFTPSRADADVIDLKLNPEAINVAHKGMRDVVESEAGSGHSLRKAHVSVAAKTGTAQAARFRYWATDADGKKHRVTPQPGTWNNPNPEFPWYRASDTAGTQLHHAWMTGFAPAENPKIAFAVLVEYAGAGGGAAAGPVAAELLDACVEHGYVPRQK